MKKLFLLLSIAGFLASCNSSADTTGEKKDSLDSIASEKKAAIDSSADQRKAQVDSTTKEKKEAVEKLDSLNKKDTASKK
jgi:hypothetical protein